MNEDRGPGAMPKLYGAPAYARPPAVPVNPVEKPFDPDELPLEAERTDEDLERASHLQPRGWDSVATAAPSPPDHDGSKNLHGRPFRIRLPGRSSRGR